MGLANMYWGKFGSADFLLNGNIFKHICEKIKYV
jgi:hypothetical protein